MEDHDDFDFEPVRGLPGALPPGETILWQGSPCWRPLARDAFHVAKVAAYFGLLMIWFGVSHYNAGAGVREIVSSALQLAAIGALAVGILGGLAWLYARTTVYTLTSRRIVIRSGLALPLTLSLPFAQIASAAVARGSHGVGAITFTIQKPARIAFLALWPNARPFVFREPQPMLRCIPDVNLVATRVAAALAAAVPGTVSQPRPVIRPGMAPADALVA